MGIQVCQRWDLSVLRIRHIVSENTLKNYICLWVLYLQVYLVCMSGTFSKQRSEEGTRSRETGVPNSSEISPRSLELNPGPFQEHQVLYFTVSPVPKYAFCALTQWKPTFQRMTSLVWSTLHTLSQFKKNYQVHTCQSQHTSMN